MKLSTEEITATIDAAINEQGKMTGELPPQVKEFSTQMADSHAAQVHVYAIRAMGKLADALGIPKDIAGMASFISIAWVGYRLRDAELAKAAEVADLDRMATR